MQDPDEAPYKSMSLSALQRVDIDYARPARDMGPLLAALLQEPVPEEPLEAAQYRNSLKAGIDIAAADSAFEKGVMEKLDLSDGGASG